ncbi:MAG TPA: hypothetical protein VF756_23850 [Thermoanaerobaculia bacterium]
MEGLEEQLDRGLAGVSLRLVERLKERFDPLRAPLLRVVFNLDRRVDLPAMEGLSVRLRPTPITHTQLDLSVNVLEEGGRLGRRRRAARLRPGAGGGRRGGSDCK